MSGTPLKLPMNILHQSNQFGVDCGISIFYSEDDLNKYKFINV